MSDDLPITRDPQFRKGVIASVIASVVVIIFIQPLLTFVWSMVLTFGSRLLKSYIDSIYVNAALGHRNYIDFVILTFMFCWLSGLMLGMNLVFTRHILRPERPKPKLRKLHLVVLWALTAFFLVSAISSAVEKFADLQLNTSFEQRLKVLAPKITDLERKELEAAWASMQTRADYTSIFLAVEQKAREHDVILPKPLWK